MPLLLATSGAIFMALATSRNYGYFGVTKSFSPVCPVQPLSLSLSLSLACSFPVSLAVSPQANVMQISLFYLFLSAFTICEPCLSGWFFLPTLCFLSFFFLPPRPAVSVGAVSGSGREWHLNCTTVIGIKSPHRALVPVLPLSVWSKFDWHNTQTTIEVPWAVGKHLWRKWRNWPNYGVLFIHFRTGEHVLTRCLMKGKREK